MQDNRYVLASASALMCIACLAGCQHQNHRPAGPTFSLREKQSESKITKRQEADMQVTLGRSLEAQGQVAQAVAAYREAVKRDPHRADAYLRLAILHDQMGKFEESAKLYAKSLAADPGNPEIYGDVGYSLYLQHRWTDAEMNLRQAIALKPDLARAHNNLGLVLAHTDRLSESLAEFRKGGSSPASAHANLAFLLALDRRWDAARKNYELALAADPASEMAKKGLRKLNDIIARTSPIPQGKDPGTQSVAEASPQTESAGTSFAISPAERTRSGDSSDVEIILTGGQP